MTKGGNSLGRKRVIPALLAAAGLVLTAPATTLAFATSQKAEARAHDFGFMPFTPAKVDPRLARKVAAIMGTDGLRFTPAASGPERKDRTVTVAVRVDEATARALSIRTAMEQPAGTDKGRLAALQLAPTRYNLGISRGYQSFAQPAVKPVAVSVGLREMQMPDLGDYHIEAATPGKPSRFQPRIALERDESTGRAPRTFQGLSDQSVDVGGSYRLGRNLNVTAGVRLLQDRSRLAPMTNGEEDSQAVYVGTQIRF